MDRVDLDNTIGAISSVFKEYIADANSLTSENSYKFALSKLGRVNFVASDVSAFAGLVSKEKFTDKANYWTVGIFVSAAINKIIKKDDVVTLDFPCMDTPVDCMGYGLKHGKIVLQGNSGDYLGEGMSGGEIIIQGNAGYYVGYAMSGGEIKVQGDVGGHVGRYMSGGVIHIEGHIGSLSEDCRGKIYHRRTPLR